MREARYNTMERIELTKEKLQEILAESQNEEAMEKYYELALKDRFVASSHGHITALLLTLVKYKFDKLFVRNKITPEYFLGLSTFNEKNEYWKFGELLEKTCWEIAFWLINDEKIPEKPLVEFSEIYAYYLFCVGDHFKCLKICNNALFREPNSSLCNFIKASLVDLCYINKTPVPYKAALINYQKKLIDKCNRAELEFDRSIYDAVYDEIDNKYRQIPDELKKAMFTEAGNDFEETIKRIPQWTKEHDFYLRKNLLLNPLSNFDKFVEFYFEELEDLPITKEYRGYFNSIVDDYKLCRSIAFAYYNGINNVGKREMAMVYSYAYSIFDKIAFLIKKVYDLDIDEDGIYFTNFGMFEKKIKNTDVKFKNIRNSNIVPLYRAMKKVRAKNKPADALDIGTWKHYELRNTIEHKSLDLVEDGELKRNTDFLLETIRDTIMYTYMLLHGYLPDEDLSKSVFTGTTYIRAIKTLNEKEQG